MSDRGLGPAAAACLFPGFDGHTAPDWLRGLLAQGLGGVVLFSRNIADPEQVAALTAALRAERPDLLVATSIFAFITTWNEYIFARVLLNDQSKQTATVWLSYFTGTSRNTDWGGLMAGSTLIAVPVIIFFLLVQGRMVAGLTSGAVKG